MLFSFTPSFDMRFLKGVGSHKSWYFFFCFLSTSSSWSKYICSICWTVWKYTTLFHNSFMFMISFKIKYDESVKIALKKFQRGGWGDFRRCVEICYFFWLMKQMGITHFFFNFPYEFPWNWFFKILIWTVQIKRFEAQVLD